MGSHTGILPRDAGIVSREPNAPRRLCRTALAALLALGCTLPPLRGKAEVGKDPYAVFVGTGPGGTDLYAFNAGTGETVAITFSPVSEKSPALSPDGATVAFLRFPPSDSARADATVWVLNLLGGGERELALPPGVAHAQRIGWARGGGAVYVATADGTWRFSMPPGSPPSRVESVARAAADSAFLVLLGDPVFARAEPCAAAPAALCVAAPDTASVLAPVGSDPARWGSDSVAFVREGVIEVRPLGGGRPRVVELTPFRRVTGGLTYFPGH